MNVAGMTGATEAEVMGRMIMLMAGMGFMILYNVVLIVVNHFRIKKGKEARYFPVIRFIK